MLAMSERASAIKQYAEENEGVWLNCASFFPDQEEKRNCLRRAVFGRGLLKCAQFVLRTLTALYVESDLSPQDFENVLSVPVGSKDAIPMTSTVLEALSHVAQWWDDEQNHANVLQRLGAILNHAAHELFGNFGFKIEIVTKPFHLFVENFLLRAPYVSDFVRCSLVVPREQYVEYLDKALRKLDSSSAPLRWIVKPDMGEEGTWPWATALLQLVETEPVGSLYAEVQIVPQDICDKQHGEGGNETHSANEICRAQAIHSRLKALGLDEVGVMSLLNETRSSNNQQQLQLGEAVSTLKTLFPKKSDFLI